MSGLSLTPNPSWLVGAEYDLTHSRHRLDPRRVPSVTQAIDLAYPNRFAGVPPDVLEHKAAIGTAVHLAAHYHAEADLRESSLAKEVQPRFAAWRWFTETRQVEPILCETVVCSRDLGLPPRRRRPYIGRLDFLCRIDRRLIALVDLKTGVPTLARMQTLAYLDALYQQYTDLIAVYVQRWAVVLNADGRYVVHVFRDDSTDAHDFRDVLERAYTAPHVDWSPPMAADTPTPAAAIAEVLPPESTGLAELIITPDVEVSLAVLKRAVAPYEVEAQEFARAMQAAPIMTADELAALGRQSVFAKERQDAVEALFDNAIRKPRLYLDRVYAVRRRVTDGWNTGGAIAARRYTDRTRELLEANRKAKAEHQRQQREAEHRAARAAADERRRLAEEAAAAMMPPTRSSTSPQ